MRKKAQLDVSQESLTKLILAAFSIIVLISAGYMIMRSFFSSHDDIMLASFDALVTHDLSYVYEYGTSTGTILTLNRPGGKEDDYSLRYAQDYTELPFTAKGCRSRSKLCFCLVNKEKGALDCRQLETTLAIKYLTRSGQQVDSPGCIGISCSAIPDADKKGDIKRVVRMTVAKSGESILLTYGPLTPVGG